MKNFSISVCFFHLNQTIAESLDQVSPEADLIWKNLIKLSKKLPFPELKEKILKSRLLCYDADEKSNTFQHKKNLSSINFWLSKDEKPIELTTINQNVLAISGKLQPFLLHDTYAFDLTLDAEDRNRDITAEDLHLFQPSSLFLDCSENSLGETIWLFGKTEITDKERYQYLADRFVK